MKTRAMSRRTLLKGGGAAIAGFTAIEVAGPTRAFGGEPGDEVIPWLDQPAPNPVPDLVPRQLVWEELDSWITPADEFFIVQHYGQPVLNGADWRLHIGGLVARPQSLTLADLRSRARQEVTFTIECSGNSGLPFLTGAVGNARWAGAPLAPLLERAGVLEDGIEVVFWGADSGQVTIRDNSGVIDPDNNGFVGLDRTGSVVPDGAGGLDLTITERFARSMTLDDALNPDNLLCYEMNGAPLPPEHGFPVRLIAPGWYGVANVKWLTRIEVLDQQYRGRFMARDYVTIREQVRDGETVWTFTNVRHDRLKSAPARVTRRNGRYRIMGAAWGAPIADVEVQIDDGPWRQARLEHHGHRRRRSRDREGFAWTFWTRHWGKPAAGVHTIRSRAFDVDGNVQPAPDDPYLVGKATFWESNGQITRRVRIPPSA
jgi:DMSO/TMAO reductase YedYZ molybdopterin-dependent catalytic subunit